MKAHLCASVFLALIWGCVEQNRCCFDDGGCDLGARCFEGQCSPTCENSNDCLSSQTCIDGACAGDVLEANECLQDACDDAQEPNDSDVNATVIVVGRLYEGLICSDDIDVFMLGSSPNDVELHIEGNVRVDVERGAERMIEQAPLRLTLLAGEDTFLRLSASSSGVAYALEVLQ